MPGAEESQPGVVLRPGDILLLAGRSLMGRVVNWFQALWAPDRKSLYNHAALLTSSNGDLYESAKQRVQFTSLKRRYRKSEVLILRWRQMTLDLFNRGMAEIAQLEGRLYPFWRQLLHAARMGRLSYGRDCVCSELVARFLCGAGARSHPWAGVNVKDLHDEMVGNPREYEVVFRGCLQNFFCRGDAPPRRDEAPSPGTSGHDQPLA